MAQGQDGRDGYAERAEVKLTVGGQPRAVSAARGSIAVLESYVDAACAKKLALLISELVTNAIIHGGASAFEPLTVEMTVSPEVVRVEVTDPGGGFNGAERWPDPSREGSPEGGWGLFIVDRVADRWGAVKDTTNCVWCELDRTDSGC
jgi:anti-sigma regulatory factor (Ser/Thr protein kinase)